MKEQYINLTDLRKVSGIGDKTIERVREQLVQIEEDRNYVSRYDDELHLDINNIHQGDCLELMNGIPDKSIDMVLCDLPYGSTNHQWDAIISFDKLWKQYERIVKDNGAIVLFSMQPFTTDVINSNRGIFKQELIWYKNIITGSLLAKKRHLRQHENILVFYRSQCTYNPQMTERTEEELKRLSKNSFCSSDTSSNIGDLNNKVQQRENLRFRYPTDVIQMNGVFNRGGEKVAHPTQKPIKLLEYLIKTYTNKGDLVLDNCIGSGTTAISAMNTNRNYIGIELDEEYYSLAKKRINDHIVKKSF